VACLLCVRRSIIAPQAALSDQCQARKVSPMLDWFKSRLRPESKRETPAERVRRIHARTPDAVGVFAETLEIGRMYAFPTSRLPLSKEEMKIAVKLAWSSTKDEVTRKITCLLHTYPCASFKRMLGRLLKRHPSVLTRTSF
jgi:hypothetical protein